jgi:hypothetical protein
MKFFTTSNSVLPDPFDGKITPGIRVEMNGGTIRVGEQGRGRRFMSVPVALVYASRFPAETDSKGRNYVTLAEGQVAVHSTSKEMIIKEPNVEHEDRALVLLSYEQGHRGTCIWEVQVRPGAWIQIPFLDDLTSLPFSIPTKLEIILRGQKAEGEAGNQSQRPEFLVIIRPGTVLRVTRTGDPKGKPKVLIFTWTGEDLMVTTPKAVADKESAKELGQRLQKHPEQFKDI